MFTSPDRLTFSTRSWFDRRMWDGLLRTADAVFLSTDSKAEELVVVAKADIEIATDPPAYGGSALDAHIRIGTRRYKGRMSPDALDRFSRWKQS